ncbi:MmcQ/YjbR family DNA-binding protein [Ferrovibrio sp.]|uniref:MmcQ/YjbR family DNA-binding protein n=1 Tax=Ferrovibrio sp. TaxID=1917215 RepID=UPI003D28E3C9
MAAKPPSQRLREICLALPEAAEQETWDVPTYRVRGKIFAMEVARAGADGRDRPAFWCKGQPGSQQILVGADPQRFFVPPYLGPKGWVGMWIDRKADWAEVAELVRRSYRQVAPRKLAERV